MTKAFINADLLSKAHRISDFFQLNFPIEKGHLCALLSFFNC